MKWVKQEEVMGCGVACLAMVLGEDYATAFLRLNRIEFTTRGLTHQALDRALARAGYAVQRKCWQDFKEWPPKPFAPVHICRMRTMEMVGTTRVHHYVVMDEKGTIYDPDNFDLCSLTQYRWTMDVAGLFTVNNGAI